MALLPLAACGEEGDVADDPTTTTTDITPEQPRLVASWSEAEARDQAAWLRANMTPRLLEGAQIERFVTGLPEPFAARAEELTATDPADTALLVAGFSECANAGEASIDGGTITYSVRRTAKYVCAWAPIRVQVFAVMRGLTLAG